MAENMARVSVIVPIYNTEGYMDKCLDSLVNQTLKDIEIIFVNDGSTDSSMVDVASLVNKDKRIKIIEQSHQKAGAARNKGMEAATGEYIGFVDSDDWVDLDYFEKLYHTAKKYNSDIALAANVRIGGNKKTKKRLNITEEKFVSTLQDKIDIQNQAKNPCPTNKIYRSAMLKNNNIIWPEGVYCEDKLFTIQAVYYANGIAAVPGVYYYYFRRPDSTVLKENKEHDKKIIEDKKKAKYDVINFLRSKNVKIRDKNWGVTDKEFKLAGIPLYSAKETLYSKQYILFGFIPIGRVNV